MSALDVLVIRGAPGVGKSTLGRGLRKTLPYGAVIEVDDLRGMLTQVDWTSRLDHDVALDIALGAVERLVALGRRPCVLIDTFSRSRLTTVQARLDAAGRHHFTLSLWAKPSVVAARLAARSTGFKDWEPSRILNDEVRAVRYPRERLVDATMLDPDGVLAIAMSVAVDANNGAEE